MQVRSPADVRPPAQRLLHSGALLLIALGLFGHLYAADAIGGSRMAYTHHVLGFVLILLVTGGVLMGLGWRFWRTRTALTLLAIGVVQALIGLWIAAEPFRSTTP
jgi:hypothetical protein